MLTRKTPEKNIGMNFRKPMWRLKRLLTSLRYAQENAQELHRQTQEYQCSPLQIETAWFEHQLNEMIARGEKILIKNGEEIDL